MENVSILLAWMWVMLIFAIAVIIMLLIANKRPKDDPTMKLIQEQMFNMTRTLDLKLSESSKILDSKMTETNKFLDSKLTDTTKMLDERLSNTTKSLDTRLADGNKLITDNMQKTFATSTKINENSNKNIEELTKKVTQLEESTKQIKDIWGQLKWLENILKNPKQRGNLWEYFLTELLENVFTPEQYALQYPIQDVWIVDAALFIWGKTIPIDSKFPQENYDRLIHAEDTLHSEKYSKELKNDIIKRITETSKYIMPESGTTDFAFMLIPAEWMYYDLFINKVGDIDAKKLIEFAFSKKVIICSPSGFYAYLQTVYQGMKALQIEEQAKEIQKYVIKLQKDLAEYEENLQSLWRSLWTSVNHYNTAYKRFSIIDKDIIKITAGEAGWDVQLLEIEKPKWDN